MAYCRVDMSRSILSKRFCHCRFAVCHAKTETLGVTLRSRATLRNDHRVFAAGARGCGHARLQDGSLQAATAEFGERTRSE